MKRLGFFILLFGGALTILFLTIVWYLTSYQPSNGTVAGMMGQMMGSQFAYGMTTPMPSYLWVVLAVLLVLIVAGVAGLGYYLAFPEIRTETRSARPPREVQSEPNNPKIDWEVLLRTSKPEEKRVLEVIASHDGKYLQKYIVKESGLSRLKTHRIVSRFAERGIVAVSKSGNTNEVALAFWLRRNGVSGEGKSA